MKRLLTFLAILLTIHGWGQTRIISGVVTGKDNGAPLAGVTVQGRSNTAVTDSTGHFSIRASAGDILTFSFVGMSAKMVKVTSTSTMTVVLEQGNNDLNQVVVTGYQSQKKADLTGAVSVVNVSEIKDIPVDLITGQIDRIAEHYTLYASWFKDSNDVPPAK